MTSTEIAIRGGVVVDGTGSSPRRADILVRDGRVVEVGRNVRADTVLDASGAVVAPGFIDIHTHYDAQVMWDPLLTPSCHQGVTTVIAGNCGFSIAPARSEDREVMIRTLEHVEDMRPDTLRSGVNWEHFETFPEYLDAVERMGIAVNFGAYLGHTALRIWAMGAEAAYTRAAREHEVLAMQRVVEEAIAAGAAGLSTSFSPSHLGDAGRPVPSRVGGLDELVAVATPMRAAGSGVLTIQIGDAVTIEDLCNVQTEIGRPITWCSLLVRAGSPYRALLDATTAARRSGCALWAQTHTNPVSFLQSLGEPFLFSRYDAFRALAGAGREARRAAYADRAWRGRACDELAKSPPDWSAMFISESTRHRDLDGRTVADVAAEWRMSPVDVLCLLSLDDDFATRFRTVVAHSDVGEVGALLRSDGVLIGLADSGAHVSQICEAGFATDFLATWVRERELMPLETAVYKMSGEPAAVFGLVDRGTLRVGAWADVCVFEPDTVGPGPVRRVRDLPASGDRLVADQPRGLRHVLVNGVPIRADGAPERAGLDTRAGHVLRAGRGGCPSASSH